MWLNYDKNSALFPFFVAFPAESASGHRGGGRAARRGESLAEPMGAEEPMASGLGSLYELYGATVR